MLVEVSTSFDQGISEDEDEQDAAGMGNYNLIIGVIVAYYCNNGIIFYGIVRSELEVKYFYFLYK
jgi:hypothetical protein